MNNKGELMREVEALRRRISVLSAASLRISASLELDTVLHEVVDSARALTGSGYGLIITLDDAGQPQDFITSGISAEEHRRLVEWPDGPRLFKHFRDLPGVLRLADVHVFVRALGFSADLLPSRTFQGTPMRHQGVHVGNFYLVDKEGGKEFSDDDEEILVLFASQAASAIANARTYRAERRARADLEALVDTSPVGVVVFNAKTGALVSLNREATRIVESLHQPGSPPAQLLNEITCRRADGREIALDQLPLSGELAGAETVRVEEIVLSTPDGRSVTTLINATPIRAEDGVVESVVVTTAGPGAAGEDGPDAGRVPEHGEPRTAGAADLHQGLDRHGARRLAGVRCGRDAAVLPHHRRAGRPHERPHRRSAGCRAYRQRHAVGCPGTFGGGRPGGPGAQHIPEQWRQAHRPYQPGAGPAAGHGRPAAHRAGAEQPVVQRRPVRSGVSAYPGVRSARRGTRGAIGVR